MKIHRFHAWEVTPKDAVRIQEQLRTEIIALGRPQSPTLVAGADENHRVIRAVVRTRDRVQSVFVSVGHRIGLAQAVRLTLACREGCRIPEPPRQADLLAERAKRGDLESR